MLLVIHVIQQYLPTRYDKSFVLTCIKNLAGRYDLYENNNFVNLCEFCFIWFIVIPDEVDKNFICSIGHLSKSWRHSKQHSTSQ